MSNRLERALRSIVVRERDRREYGTLPNDVALIVVTERPDYVRVNMEVGTMTQALNKGIGAVPLRAGLPVKLMRRSDGELVLDGIDTTLLEGDAGAPGTVYSVNGATGYVVLTQDNVADGTTYKQFSATEKTKLAGIATGATVYTDEMARDALGVALTAGTGIAITPNDAGDTITIASTGTSSYTDEMAQDAVGDMFTGNVETDITVTYQDATAKVDFVVNPTLVGDRINAAAEKVTPIDADTMPLIDSAASNVLKKVTWANIKATLLAYFSPLFAVLAGTTGGQSLSGGTAANDGLTLHGSAHATKGPVVVQPTAGNVGLGTTDVEAWGSNYVGVQFGGSSAWMAGRTTEGFYQIDGAYFDGTNWKRRNATVAPARIAQTGGIHYISVAATGAADSTITWTDVVVISSSGIGIGTSSQFGSGSGVIGLANAAVVPTTNPTNAYVLYAEGGAMKGRGSSGTITTIGASDPHCPVCGADYVAEFDNEKYGYFVLCLRCMADELGPRPWINWKNKPEH